MKKTIITVFLAISMLGVSKSVFAASAQAGRKGGQTSHRIRMVAPVATMAPRVGSRNAAKAKAAPAASGVNAQ